MNHNTVYYQSADLAALIMTWILDPVLIVAVLIVYQFNRHREFWWFIVGVSLGTLSAGMGQAIDAQPPNLSEDILSSIIATYFLAFLFTKLEKAWKYFSRNQRNKD